MVYTVSPKKFTTNHASMYAINIALMNQNDLYGNKNVLKTFSFERVILCVIMSIKEIIHNGGYILRKQCNIHLSNLLLTDEDRQNPEARKNKTLPNPPPIENSAFGYKLSK